MLTALIYFIIAIVHAVAISRPTWALRTEVVMVFLYVSLAAAYLPFSLSA